MKKKFVSRGFLPQNMGCVADHCVSDVSRRLSFYYFGNNICQSRHSRESGNQELDWMPDQVRHDIRYLMEGEMIDPERCAQRRAVACPLHPVVRSFFSHNALWESRLRQFALSGTSDNEGVRRGNISRHIGMFRQ